LLFYLHGNQLCHSLACHTVAGKDVRIVHLKKLSLKNIKIDKNEEIILSSDTLNSENLEVVCVWLVPSLLPLLVGRHETVQRPSLVFPHFFCILFHYFLTAMQEEALKLVLLALEDGSALSRKVLVLFVVQRLEPRFPQASKTSIGHVVQLLYRASCFKV